MTPAPKPLDQQVADDHARHPTPREATRPGIAFGLAIGLAVLALNLFTRLLPAELAGLVAQGWGRPPGIVLGVVFSLGFAVLMGVVLAQVGAAILRWRRRVAAQLWYRDPVP